MRHSVMRISRHVELMNYLQFTIRVTFALHIPFYIASAQIQIKVGLMMIFVCRWYVIRI